MTTAPVRATSPVPEVAVATAGAPVPAVDDLPANVQRWDDVLLLPWGVDASERPLILVDADLLFTRPPVGAETLAVAVQRIVGEGT